MTPEPVRAVTRAAAILDMFTLETPVLSLTEISRGIGLNKSTTHRLLATLEHLDLLEVDSATRRYRLGLKLFRLGSVVLKSMELVAQAEPLLKRLVEQTEETAFLIVPEKNETLCLKRVDGCHSVRALFLETGKRLPYNAGAGPRALLAHLPEEDWDRVVVHHVQRMTHHSLVTREELARDKAEVHRLGYSLSREDVSLHACAVGAPVREREGRVVAAVSVSGIVQRFSPAQIPLLVAAVVQAAEELSRRLGFVPLGGNRLGGSPPDPDERAAGVG
ncbi:MAG: IclR family transcriptional regulator [Thermoleophilia bacterium]|nr:IclR family transcriptional regulator [Thermoleophilia bacterium]